MENIKSRNELKAYFVSQAKPSQQQFHDLLDSVLVKGDDKVVVSDLEDTILDEINSKAKNSDLDLRILVSEKGQASGVASLDVNGIIPVNQLPSLSAVNVASVTTVNEDLIEPVSLSVAANQLKVGDNIEFFMSGYVNNPDELADTVLKLKLNSSSGDYYCPLGTLPVYETDVPQPFQIRGSITIRSTSVAYVEAVAIHNEGSSFEPGLALTIDTSVADNVSIGCSISEPNTITATVLVSYMKLR